MGKPTALELSALWAQVDQHVMAIREAKWRWPDNEQFWDEKSAEPWTDRPHELPAFADERIFKGILLWMLNPPAPDAIRNMHPGTIYLVWMATGALTDLPRSWNVEEVVHHEQSAWKTPECDRCGRQDVMDESRGGEDDRTFIGSFLLVRHHAWLFAFGLCGACSHELGQDENTRLIRPLRKDSNG